MAQQICVNTDPIPKELVKSILKRKVVPFIGAGFSIPFGYPNWKDLIIGIKEEIGITNLDNEDIKNVDPLQIAQALFHYYSKTNFLNCREEILKDLDINIKQIENNEALEKLVQEQTKHKLELDFSRILLGLVIAEESKQDIDQIVKIKKLNDLEFNLVVTTNYDKVLEDDIFSSQSFKVQSLGKNEELDWNEKERTIIKIHGDKESNNGIIFTHSQYYKFMNEYGYFRSKLYTIFSSNIVLMMGYGFNDINIHQIYFQFLRDYGKNINGSKFYMVLTEYDYGRWQSYFEFYKYYLESYKIEVLLVKDLPTFIENLVEAVNNERDSKSLESLFDTSATNDFLRIMKCVTSNKYCDVIYDFDLNINLINAFLKIFKDEYLLSMEPLNLEDTDLSIVGRSILEYTVRIFGENEELTITSEFYKILNIAIEFTNQTRDFYSIKYRLEIFLDLNKYVKVNELVVQDDFERNLYEVFGYCHPTQYLRSNPGGQLLETRIRDLAEPIIIKYLDYILSNNMDEETIYLDSVHKYWIRLIKSKIDNAIIQSKIESIFSVLED